MSPTALLNVVKGHSLHRGVDGLAAGSLSVRVAELSPALSFWTVKHWQQSNLPPPPKKNIRNEAITRICPRNRYRTIYQDIHQEFVYIYCHMCLSSVQR